MEASVFSVLDQLIRPGHLLVGFSGGLDSRVLLELLARYISQRDGFSLQAVHVHHGLNPKADQWLTHCAQVCDVLTVPFIAKRVEIEKKARQSLEDLARQARYDVFRQNLPEGGVLLTAHHQDDQLETLLLALKRGSGPRGLSAMPVKTAFAGGHLVRPLLTFSRQQLSDWAISQQLSWIEDDSNQDDRFDRNFLRQKVIPLLRQRWPEITATASRTAGLCAEQETLLDEIAQQDLMASQHPDGSLDISLLDNLSLARRHQLLRFWLRQRTGTVPSQVQLQKIWPEVALAREDATPELVWQKGIIRRYQHRLYQVNADVSTPIIPSILRLQIDMPLSLPGGILTLRSDHSAHAQLRMPVPNEQLTVVFNLPGSVKVHPVGRQHSRELKKLWQEYGVAPWLRSTVPVICYQDKVAAAAGVFICQEYCCPEDRNGLRIDWQPNS
ncbi:tRNA(Ile)-lysidine synthetase [Tolumonas auensis DSM 9187]|uniref:tRNA(Ile)-lysidine synthase n=1 Tax=Tolumonas auensis (strain DSM 9187 / NBRC 110442 / TA 4) TaxID=595494 RepID=C4LBX5_TOLAT|nr:tRNA(Ile)-lysidine synthetase [Tolumonas auensis DSM 9187]